jgi:hypothetical protein
MKALVAVAAGVLATVLTGHVQARQVRTTFSFVVSIDDRVWPYNDNFGEDVNVLLPSGSPWRCTRQKLMLPADDVATGTMGCTADGGKTRVLVSASCGLESEDHHNSVTIASGNSLITLTANCVTSVYDYGWLGF